MTDVCTMCGDSGVDRWGQSCDCEWNTASGFVVRRLRVTDLIARLEELEKAATPEAMKPYPFDQACGTKAFRVTKPCERARRALLGEQVNG